MAAITTQIHGLDVPVTAEPGIRNIDSCLNAAPFLDWKTALDPSIQITDIHLQSVDMFGERVGFLKFKANALRNGLPIPGVVFMRGGAVCILVILECEGRKYSLLCRQVNSARTCT
jgi:ADP-sugar diphosphatase